MGKDKTQKIQEATLQFLKFYHSKHELQDSAPLSSMYVEYNNTYWFYSDCPTCSGMLSYRSLKTFSLPLVSRLWRRKRARCSWSLIAAVQLRFLNGVSSASTFLFRYLKVI